MFNWLQPAPRLKPQTLGQLGEVYAQQEYKKQGYKVIASNFFNKKGFRLGEVDFIAKNKQALVFVEVKTRTEGTEKFGSGAEAVNWAKQSKLLKAVKIFIQQNKKYQPLRPQIDVCLVKFNGVDKNAHSVKIIPNAVEDWN